jgi:hypothetical protein
MNESLTYCSEDEYKTVTFMLSLTTNVWGETTSTLVEAIQLEQVDSLNQESLHRNSQGVSTGYLIRESKMLSLLVRE